MRFRLIAAACAAACFAAACLAGPASAITPVIPVEIASGADVQVERSATSLPQLLSEYGIAPASAGNGVKVAVIDSGIAVYPSGWQARTNDCFTDEGYPVTEQLGDTRFTNNKVIVARVYGPGAERDSSVPDGAPHFGSVTAEAAAPHGSHVAGIIGCNAGTTAYVSGSRAGQISGIAPAVQLGSYNVFPGTSEFGSDPAYLADAIDDAVADGMDVINMSLGGPPSAADPLVHAAIRRAEAAGVLVVVAAGNEGPENGTVGSPGVFQESLTVGATDGGRVLSTQMTVDGTSYEGPVGGIGIPVRRVAAPLAMAVDKSGKLSKACSKGAVTSDVSGKVVVVARGTCTFFDKLVNLQEMGAVGAVVVSERGNPVAAMSSTSDEVLNLAAVMVPFEATKALRQAAAKGATATFSTPVLSVAKHVNEVASFSSAGPAPSTRLVKPDIVAPGSNILSATADPKVQSSCGVSGTCFQVMSGTSMATPYVVGLAAILRQLHPDWSVPMLRSALAHTADASAVLGSDAGNRFRAGGGLVDPLAAARATFGIAQTSLLVKARSKVTFVNPSDTALTVTLSATDGFALSTQTVSVPPLGSTDVTVTRGSARKGAIGTLTATDGVTLLHMNLRAAR